MILGIDEVNGHRIIALALTNICPCAAQTMIFFHRYTNVGVTLCVTTPGDTKPSDASAKQSSILARLETIRSGK